MADAVNEPDEDDECPHCHGRMWMCEAHPDLPFEHPTDDGTVCPGPGDPCVCNPLHGHKWEDITDA